MTRSDLVHAPIGADRPRVGHGGVFDVGGVGTVGDGAGLVFPVERPRVAVWVESDRVATAVDGSGSFVVVDGTVWRGGRRLSAGEVLGLVCSEGPGVLASSSGFASVTVWDAGEGCLHLARHPGGVPTIYLRVEGDRVRWADRLEAVRAPGDRVDRVALAGFLVAGALTGPETMDESVREVAPGTVVTFPGGRVRSLVPSGPTERVFWSREEKARRIGEVLPGAIERALEGEREPALLLSGGIDSVLLAAVTTRELGIVPVAHTVTFPGEVGRVDEFPAADEVTSRLGIPHEPLLMTPEWVVEHLGWMAAWYEEPFDYGLHTANLSPLAGRHRRVMAGTGPDYWFPSPTGHQAFRWADRTPPPIRPWVGRTVPILERLPIRGARRLRKLASIVGLEPADRIAHSAGSKTSERLVGRLVGPDLVDRALERRVAYYRERLAAVESGSMSGLYAWVGYHLGGPEHDVLWMWRWPAAYGLRPALPYLDPEVEGCFASWGNREADRAEMRWLATRWLPEEAAYRKKVGQSVPLAEWFRGPLAGFLRDWLSPSAVAADGLFDPTVVTEIVDRHLRGETDHKWDLWKLVILTAWYRTTWRP